MKNSKADVVLDLIRVRTTFSFTMLSKTIRSVVVQEIASLYCVQAIKIQKH